MTSAEETIYLDHAATTPVDERVLRAMWPYFAAHFANPSSRYPIAEHARHALDWARHTVAAALGAQPSEIVFTSGGTESDNLALKGVTLTPSSVLRPAQRSSVVVSQIEHHAVLRAADWLAAQGHPVVRLPVDRTGLVDLGALAAALEAPTALVSIMTANNEVGTIQPVREIAALCRRAGIPFHTDAVQAAGALELHVDDLGVDLLSLSGHKLYGPKGTGVLYVRRGVALEPQLHGGPQERERRAGTENVPGAVGLATALSLAVAERAEEAARLTRLRDRLIDGVLARVPGALLTGHPTLRLPGHASFCFEGVQGEAVLVELALAGVACSSGSACAEGQSDPSHVLTALGYPPALAHTAVRFTLGRATTETHVDRVLELLPGIVRGLRAFATVG